MPSYVRNSIDKLKAKGVDEVWCVSVNDAFVMGAYEQRAEGQQQGAHDGRRQRDLHQGDGTGDGSHLPAAWVCAPRYAMVVDNGVVKSLNVEAPGKFEVSDAESLLKAL